ncbi:MAG: hypothetical protein IJ268_07460 [Proteobacteria bacterium]|nr:hypothetical protein [Pseudomonadota bacterium]MBQ9241935.1 hypothetical protein [Pseudomonadota bacterium]
MRKRHQYNKPKPASKVPTLIIMCVLLFSILFFGKDVSDNIAAIFAPNIPVTDAPRNDTDIAVSTQKDAGDVVSSANKEAARSLLNIIAKGK